MRAAISANSSLEGVSFGLEKLISASVCIGTK